MRPFTGYMRGNLSKLDMLDIKLIAPSHGPFLKINPKQYIELYKQWSIDKTEGSQQVAIFFASNYGNTEKMAQVVNQSITQAGLRTKLVDLTSCTDDEARDIIESSVAILIGTPTLNCDAPKPVWDLVGLFSSVYSLGKKAAVFGSYGWSGEAVKLVSDRLSAMKLKTYAEPYKARLVPSEQELIETADFANKVAEFIKG
jgi:NADH oxidase (H2O-forming)